MTDADDPMEGADVGETKTVRRSKTLHGINFEPGVYYGSDRFADARIVDVEVIEGDDGRADDVKITWESEVTKALPPKWDYCREPRTEEEEKQAWRRKWVGRVAKAVAFVVPIGISTAIAYHLTNALSDDLMINGEPLGSVTFLDLFPVLLLVFGLATLITWGIRAGFPMGVRA